MTQAAGYRRLPDLDDPRRRLPWLLPAAVLAWIAMLAGFARLLEQSASPSSPPPAAIEARIIEVPADQPRTRQAPPVTAAPAPVKMNPSRAPRSAQSSHPSVRLAPAPVSSAPASGGDSAPPQSAPASNESSDAGGIGAADDPDAGGARAVYAPAPEIPDDLREEPLTAEAVAHFTVSRDGAVAVALTTSTPNSRLNQVILKTLKSWRFEPAVKDGAAIDTEFDIRIPISIQ
jgi:protein TonB